MYFVVYNPLTCLYRRNNLEKLMLEKLILNKKQLDRLSEFFNNLSLVYFASIIAPLISGDLLKLYLVFSGVFIAISLLVISLYILK